jgi:hypothetical protein
MATDLQNLHKIHHHPSSTTFAEMYALTPCWNKFYIRQFQLHE